MGWKVCFLAIATALLNGRVPAEAQHGKPHPARPTGRHQLSKQSLHVDTLAYSDLRYNVHFVST